MQLIFTNYKMYTLELTLLIKILIITYYLSHPLILFLSYEKVFHIKHKRNILNEKYIYSHFSCHCTIYIYLHLAVSALFTITI